MALATSVTLAQTELQRLNALSLSSSAILDNRNLVPFPNQPPILIIPSVTTAPATSTTSSSSSSSSSLSASGSLTDYTLSPSSSTTSSVPVNSTSHDNPNPSASNSSSSSLPSSTPNPNQDIRDEELMEDSFKEIRRLENTIHDLTEINDRIMAQNIALLGDLEAAQRAVRELRGEKDALALQLRKALETQQ